MTKNYKFYVKNIFLGLVFAPFISFAQRNCDLELTTIHPINNDIIYANDTFYLSGSIKNLGTDAIAPQMR